MEEEETIEEITQDLVKEKEAFEHAELPMVEEPTTIIMLRKDLQEIAKEFPDRPVLGADIIKFLEFNWFPKYEIALKKLKELANATV